MYMYVYVHGIVETSILYMYHIAGNIGGELYLADWRISCHTVNIKSANIVPTAGEGVAIVP